MLIFFSFIYLVVLINILAKIITNIYPNCVSLIIPSTSTDFNRCLNILLNSVCKSIRYPEEVILIISGVKKELENKFKSRISPLNKCTKQLIVLLRTGNYNAASNRNYGYLHSHCSILSFFDIDDLMSKYRILFIHKMFSENKNIDVVFHPYTRNYSSMDKFDIKLYEKNIITNQYKRITKKCRKTFQYNGRIFMCDVSNGFFITNGWPSIKRIIMRNIQYNETLYSTEDLDFISRIVVKGYKVSVFKKPLGFYIKDFNCNMNYI